MVVDKQRKEAGEEAATLPNKLGELERMAERGVTLLCPSKIVKHIVLQDTQI